MRALRKSAIITPAQDEKTIGKMTEWIMENVMGGPGPDDKIGKGDEGEESKGEGLEGIDSGMSGKAIFVS